MKFSLCLTNYHTNETSGTVNVQLHTLLLYQMRVNNAWLLCPWGGSPQYQLDGRVGEPRACIDFMEKFTFCC